MKRKIRRASLSRDGTNPLDLSKSVRQKCEEELNVLNRSCLPLDADPRLFQPNSLANAFYGRSNLQNAQPAALRLFVEAGWKPRL